MDNTHAAHTVKPCTTLFELVMDCGGGFIPTEGYYNSKVWARLIGVTDRTIRNWVEEHGIPYRKPGSEIFIDAGDLLRHVPYFKNGTRQSE